ncbi:hypothetical protein Tco_0063713 [Tanacetum coccineum]
MSTNGQTPLSQLTSVVRNALGKELVPQDLGRPIFDEVHQEKVQHEKLKAVKACLNFEETSHHSESGTPTRRRGLKERLGPRHVRSRSGSPSQGVAAPSSKTKRRVCLYTQTTQGVGRTTVVTGTPKAATKVPDQEQRSPPLRDVITKEHPQEERRNCQKEKVAPEVIGSQKMPSHIKTYDGSEDPEDHLKIFQSAAKTERWAMPTWCHMFNSTLTGNARVWFDDLPKETIDSYDDLKKTFLENYCRSSPR